MAEIIILGGGVAGISAGYHAKQLGLNGEVREASDRMYGLLDNFTVGQFKFDKAVHLSFTSDPYVRSIFDQTNYLTHFPLPYNYDNTIWLKHPVQNNLYGLSPKDKVQAIKDFINKPKYEEINNYQDWLLAQFGKYITERFPLRYTKKYWTINASGLSLDWVNQRIYLPTLDEVLLGAFTDETPATYYAKEMRYPTNGGYKSFIEPMLKQTNYKINKRAVYINTKKKYVEYSDSSIENFEYLFSSLPLPELVNMLEDVPRPVKIASSELWATSVALVSIGFNRADIPKHLWFYIYDENIFAARAYSPSLKSHDNAPVGCSSLQFEIYYSKHQPLLMNKEALLEHIIYSLEKMNIATSKDIIETDVRFIKYANVVFDKDMLKNRAVVRNYLDSLGIYTIGRFGEWDYLWSDQSLLSGKKSMEQLYFKIGSR